MAKVGLGLSDYWLIIRKRKWISILCFLAIFLSVVIHVQIQPPVYQAACSIRIIERKSISDMITEMVSYTSYDLMRTLPKVLHGRPVIEKVVYELGLADENTPLKDLNQSILDIQAVVEAESVKNTNLISITAKHRNPEMAAKIANTVANVFIKFDMEEKSERTHNIRIFLEEQLAKSEQKLTQAEDRLTEFRKSGKVTGIALSIQGNITALQKEKINLRKIFTEKYPDVVKINEQIEELKKQLQALPEDEIEYARITRELQVSEGSYRQLQIKLEEARIAEAEKVQDVRMVNPALAPTSPIKPQKGLAVALGLVVGLITGIFMSFVVETLDTSIGTIDDLESLLKLPVLAVIPYMKTEVEKGKRQPILLALRQLRIFRKPIRGGPRAIEQMRNQLLIKYGQRSSITEAYRILRTNIKIEELLKTDKRILLVTSTIPKEGKSIIALNLSLALAQDGYKTLLVDCDLRKAIIHKIFKMNKEPGLTDVLLGSSKPEAAVRNFVDLMMGKVVLATEDALAAPGLDNFNLLTCGKIVTNPAELLDSSNIDELFSNLKSQYNFVVIDSPPVLPVPDTIILGRKVVDMLYLVYRSGYTSKLAVLRAKEQLNMMKVLPSGIILNSTTPESQIVSDYYHHYYHYRYYTEKEEEKK